MVGHHPEKNSNRSPIVSRFSVLIMLLVISWITMTFTHELGHLVGGWCGGATLLSFDIVPWRLPYSLHNPDPHPRLTLWAGPILGVLIPFGLALLLRFRWAWFIADFCMLANGSYLALAWLSGDHLLDTPRLLAAGVHPVIIALYCFITIVIGYIRFRADCRALLTFEPSARRKAEG